MIIVILGSHADECKNKFTNLVYDVHEGLFLYYRVVAKFNHSWFSWLYIGGLLVKQSLFNCCYGQLEIKSQHS